MGNGEWEAVDWIFFEQLSPNVLLVQMMSI